MRAMTDLLKCKLIFTQQDILHATVFLEQCKRRGLGSPLFWSQLESLHRAGIFFPIYRFAKNVRGVLALYRRPNPPSKMVELVLNHSSLLHSYLEGHTDAGRMLEPRKERFRSWREYHREFKHDRRVWTSDFLYSPYQLLVLPDLRFLFRKMRARRIGDFDYSFRLKLDEQSKEDIAKRFLENDQLVFVLSALETKYRPKVTGRISGIQ